MVCHVYASMDVLPTAYYTHDGERVGDNSIHVVTKRPNNTWPSDNRPSSQWPILSSIACEIVQKYTPSDGSRQSSTKEAMNLYYCNSCWCNSGSRKVWTKKTSVGIDFFYAFEDTVTHLRQHKVLRPWSK